MPHIIIEYSDNLSTEIKESGLMEKSNQIVLDSKLFSPEAVKARAIAYGDYVLPDGVKNFIHITISILDGRNVEQRLALSEAVYQGAVNTMSNADKISVDIHEMSKETYKK